MSVKNQIWQSEQPSPAFSKSFPVTWILISNKLSMWDLNEYKNIQIPNIKSSTTLVDKVKANVWNIWIGLVQYKWKDSKFWVFSVEDKVKEAQIIALLKMLSLTYVSASHQELCSLRGALCGAASPSTEFHHRSREGLQGRRSRKEGEHLKDICFPPLHSARQTSHTLTRHPLEMVRKNRAAPATWFNVVLINISLYIWHNWISL